MVENLLLYWNLFWDLLQLLASLLLAEMPLVRCKSVWLGFYNS